MASVPAKRQATYQDVLDAPRHVVAEILSGELYLSPRPGARHARAASRLGRALGPFDDDPGQPGGWVILDEPELHLVGMVMVPDLAGWRRSRMPAVPPVSAFELAPDWVCEVISPSTAAVDRADKLPAYARAGVGHAWLIDPDQETLEVFRLAGGAWTLVGAWRGAVSVVVEPFQEVELNLSLLWAR